MSFIKRILIFVFLLFSLATFGQTSIKRICINPNLQDIIISLEPVSDPCDSFHHIDIYARQSNLVPFVLIDSLFDKSVTSYTHVNAGTVGNTWSYFFIYHYLCDGNRSISDTLRIDLSQPSITSIDSVSYDPLTSKLNIGWSENAAIDRMGYKIWRANGNNNIPIDSTNQTEYLDNLSNPLNGPQSYRLSVYDSCLNQSVISTPHTSMFLQFTGNRCNNLVTLTHNAYQGTAVSRYDLYQRVLPDPDFSIIASQSQPYQNFPQNLQSGDSVEFFVRAHFTNGYSSRSNPVLIVVLDSFTYLYDNPITSISWNAKDQYIITFSNQFQSDLDSGYLYLYENNTDRLMESALYQTLSTSAYIASGLKDTLVHYFRLQVSDVCKRWYLNNSYQSNQVLAQIENEDPEYISLIYTNTLSQPNYHQLFFASDIPVIDQTMIYQGTDTSNRTPLLVEEAQSCYQSLAFKDGNRFISNPICIQPQPSYYLPTAISPIGKNKEFFVFGTGINRTASQLQIYNRWGQMVYEHDLTKGWDGTHQNQNVQEGMYLYILKIAFSNGEQVFEKGSITVLY